MFGTNIGTLNVKKRYSFVTEDLEPLFSWSGNRGDFWYRFEQNLTTSDTRDFEVFMKKKNKFNCSHFLFFIHALRTYLQNIFMVCDLQVVIEGIVGNGYFGDIAIDDISLTPGCQFAVSK